VLVLKCIIEKTGTLRPKRNQFFLRSPRKMLSLINRRRTDFHRFCSLLTSRRGRKVFLEPSVLVVVGYVVRK